MNTLNDLHQISSTFSNTEKMPVLFLGHGSPMNAIEENQFVTGFRELAKTLPQPNAILCISAHWFTKPPLSYQWRSYSSPTVFTNMPGETNTILVLTDVQTTRRYGVEVSNTSGAVTNQAVLRVGLPAGITQHPASATVEQGTPFSLSVVATGSTALLPVVP